MAWYITFIILGIVAIAIHFWHPEDDHKYEGYGILYGVRAVFAGLILLFAGLMGFANDKFGIMFGDSFLPISYIVIGILLLIVTLRTFFSENFNAVLWKILFNSKSIEPNIFWLRMGLSAIATGLLFIGIGLLWP